MRDKNLNEKFYNKLGFKNIGKWRMYRWHPFLI
jgi:predicted GNAT family acetyltransferase